MKTGTIKAKHFKSAPFRIDPSFHLSEGIKVRSMLENVPYGLTTVKEASDDVFIGNIFSRVFVKDENHGVPYLAASDTVLANLDTGRFLSFKQASELSYLILQKDWILSTCSGTLGNVSYTNSEFAGKIATHDLIRIVPNDNIILRGCLYAFLSSKYGYYQLTESQFGGVVKHINSAHASSIKIPCFEAGFQEKVDKLIKQSSELRDIATAENHIAIEKLNVSIGMQITNKKNRNTSVNIKDILSSLQYRIDPPAIINDGVSMMEQIKIGGMKYKCVKNINATVYRPGIFKRCYVSEGYPYIKGSEIFERNPFRRCEHISFTKTPFVEDMLAREGQVMITCAGAVGDIKIITKEYEDKVAIASQDIIRVVSHDELFTKEYLFAYFQLPFVQDYIQSMKYGAVIERIEPFHVESIPVVEPTKELSEEVTKHIKRYMDCTYEAFLKEEEAVNMIESEIEKWNN